MSWKYVKEAYADKNYWDYVKQCNNNLTNLNNFANNIFIEQLLISSNKKSGNKNNIKRRYGYEMEDK